MRLSRYAVAVAVVLCANVVLAASSEGRGQIAEVRAESAQFVLREL
jgi:hypothetical protein